MKPETQIPFDLETAWREQRLREMRAMKDLPILEKFRLVEEMGDYVALIQQVKRTENMNKD